MGSGTENKATFCKQTTKPEMCNESVRASKVFMAHRVPFRMFLNYSILRLEV